MTPGQIATLKELAEDLEHIVAVVSSRDGDATARQHSRAESVRAAIAMAESMGTPIGSPHREHLRRALVGIVGCDGRDELENMEAAIRLAQAPADDKAKSLDAIHALLDTL